MQIPVKPATQTHKMTWVFWITLPILLGSMLLAVVLSAQDAQSKELRFQFSDLWHNDNLPAIIISALVLVLLNRIKLSWSFTDTGFHFVYYPFIFRKKHIPYEEIASIEIVKINPLRDFGGWGLRYSKKWGKAYTTSGNIVLRITLHSGKMLNFTADPESKMTKPVTS